MVFVLYKVWNQFDYLIILGYFVIEFFFLLLLCCFQMNLDSVNFPIKEAIAMRV